MPTISERAAGWIKSSWKPIFSIVISCSLSVGLLSFITQYASLWLARNVNIPRSDPSVFEDHREEIVRSLFDICIDLSNCPDKFDAGLTLKINREIEDNAADLINSNDYALSSMFRVDAERIARLQISVLKKGFIDDIRNAANIWSPIPLMTQIDLRQ